MKLITPFLIIISLFSSSCFHSKESRDTIHVINVTPTTNSQNVYIGEEITIEFDRPVSREKMQVSYNDTLMYTYVKNFDRTKYGLKPPIPLQANTEYTIKVSDIIDTEELLDKTEYSWSFSTSSPSTFTETKLFSGARGNACLIDKNSDIYCWGAGKSVPQKLITEDFIQWKDISVGKHVRCAIDIEQQLWCWADTYPLDVFQEYVYQPKLVRPDIKWKNVVVGYRAICAISTENHLYCWGQFNGSEHEYSKISFNTPQKIESPIENINWQFVSIGEKSGISFYNYFCGILENGSLWCWDYRYPKENYEYEFVIEPRQIGSHTNWVDVLGSTDSFDSACAINSNGELYCWRYDSENIIRIERIGDESDWKRIVGYEWMDVCVSKLNGSLYCGFPRNTDHAAFKQNIHADVFVNLQNVDHRSYCGRTEMGKIKCWGENSRGILGAGFSKYIYNPTEITNNNGDKWQSVSLSNGIGCGLTNSTNEIYCWGRYAFPSSLADSRVMSKLVEPSNQWSLISTREHFLNILSEDSYYDRCAVSADESSKVYCSDSLGKINVLSVEISNEKIVELDTNENKCALTESGKIYCWDVEDEFGSFVEVIAIDEESQLGVSWSRFISNGKWHAVKNCAIRSDGKLFCWSFSIDTETQVVTYELTPVQEKHTWKTASIGSDHSCGIDENYILFCWGSNASYNFASDKPKSSKSPVPVNIDGVDSWAQISVNADDSCAIDSVGQLYCWGSFSATLGKPTSFGVKLNKVISSENNSKWKSVNVNSSNVCALKTDNTLWCWGSNYDGQTGSGTSMSFEPVSVVGP